MSTWQKLELSLTLQIPKFGIVLVVLVLGALGFRDRKETDVLQLICSAESDCETIGILEDEDDDEHEDDSSNSEFTLKSIGVLRGSA